MAESEPKRPSERRRAERVEYDAVVMMAEYDGKQVPRPGLFQPVETHDLSPIGISFFTDRPPQSELLVLQMGNPDEDPIYVTARVVHCNEGFWNRKRQFRVGCELTGRLSGEG